MPENRELETFQSDVEQAIAAAASYYDTGTLLMSDADYDKLIERIEQGHARNPHWDHRGLLDQVAAGASVGGDVQHPTPMGSLEKVKELSDLAAFAQTVGGPVVVEPKLDGMAVRVEYRRGSLALLATRGDGSTGENVTGNAGGVTGLPKSLPEVIDLEVRGEIYMSDQDFEQTNSGRINSGKKGFANSRNAVAGTLRNSSPDYQVHMSFAAYDASWADAPETYQERMDRLRTWGIKVASDLVELGRTHSESTVNAAVQALGAARETLGFPIDGAVVKADRDSDRDRLGFGSRAPKWAVAFKYAPNEATSVLRDIEIGVGRTGRITLRGRIDPVDVGGTSISYATLHNPEFIQQQDLRIGQRVLVVRAGDVIPRITASVDSQDQDLPVWQAPKNCPQCGQKWDTSSVLWRCRTAECSVTGRITYAVSRDCLDIVGASDAVCSALVEAGLVRDIADLLELDKQSLSTLVLGETETGKPRQLGPVVAAKLHAELQQARKRPLAKVLASLGVRTLGRTLSRRITARYSTLSQVRAASASELAEVDGIGTEKAAIIAQELGELTTMLDRLEGILQTPSEDAPAGGALQGMTVVVTGAMTGPLADLSRNQVNDLIEQHGGRASGSVSAKTHLVVSSDDTSSKARKAAGLGIDIETPEQFAARLGLQGS